MIFIPDINSSYEHSKNILCNQMIKSEDKVSFDFLSIADEIGFQVPVDTLEQGLIGDFPHLEVFNLRASMISEYAESFKFTRRSTPFHKQISQTLSQDRSCLRLGSSFMLALDELKVKSVPDGLSELEIEKICTDLCNDADIELKATAGISESNPDKTEFVIALGNSSEGPAIALLASEYCHFDFDSFSEITDRSVSDVVYKLLSILTYYGDVQFISETYEDMFSFGCDVHEFTKDFMKFNKLSSFDDLRTYLQDDSVHEEFIDAIEGARIDPEEFDSFIDYIEFTSTSERFLPDDFFTDLNASRRALLSQIYQHLNSDPNWGGKHRLWITDAAQTLDEIYDIYPPELQKEVSYVESESYDIFYASTLSINPAQEYVVQSTRHHAYHCGTIVETLFTFQEPIQSQAAVAKIIAIIKARQILGKGIEYDDGQRH